MKNKEQTTTIFIIYGGGRLIRQHSRLKLAVKFVKNENSDWPRKSGCLGSKNLTGIMWSVKLKTLQKWANEWAGETVNLIESSV